jgi:molybdopterin synthase sulfur carrier subunit
MSATCLSQFFNRHLQPQLPMANVYIPAAWRDLTGAVAEVEVEGNSLRQIIAALDARFPGIASRACDGGEIAGGLAVSIDGAIAARGLLARVGPASEIHFLPAIGGG